MIIYLAGPLFGLAERIFHTEFAKALEYCYMPLQVVLPVDHHGRPGVLGDGHRLCCSIIDAIDESDAVVAVLDGADADSWTYFGIGYAKGRGKFVIGVRTDAGSDEGCNPALGIRGACDALVAQDGRRTTVDNLAEEVADVLARYARLITTGDGLALSQSCRGDRIASKNRSEPN